MKSKRLKKKALLDINGKPLLECLIDRINEKIDKNKIIVCTSINKSDDEIESFSLDKKISFYRGEEDDVIKRFLGAAKKYNAKNIARVTGDNPLTDPDCLLRMYNYHIEKNSEYTFTDDLPIGTRSEIINVQALKRIHSDLSDPSFSEYMTYMLKRPDKLKVNEFKIKNHLLKRPEISLTVDNKRDYELLNEIYINFENKIPNLLKIIKWLDKSPEKRIVIPIQAQLHPLEINCSYIGD